MQSVHAASPTVRDQSAVIGHLIETDAEYFWRRENATNRMGESAHSPTNRQIASGTTKTVRVESEGSRIACASPGGNHFARFREGERDNEGDQNPQILWVSDGYPSKLSPVFTRAPGMPESLLVADVLVSVVDVSGAA